MAPFMTASASVLVWPLASMPQPSGMALPARRCSSMSPRAMALVAKSKMNGCLPARGQPKAMGLVPKIGLLPPAGATQAWLGLQARATSPASVSASISTHNAEKCTQRLIASAAMPLARALSLSTGKPAWNASWEKPPRASTRTIAGAWSITSGSASATTLPALSELTQPSTRYNPWEAQPSRSPATTVVVTAWACASLKPARRMIDSVSSRASSRDSRIIVNSFG